MRLPKFTFGKFQKETKSKQDAAAQRTMQQRQNILSAHSGFYTREAYKALRTNITFAVPKEGCCKICVTSAEPSEGKSITTLNLALSFVEAGQRVLLIDADLRKPNQARLLRMKATPGLSNLLANLCTLEDAVNKNARGSLDVIFAGDVPPNPSELLGTPRMKTILESLESQYDYIFIDTPPVNIVTDASVVAPLLDGVLFLVRQGRSEYDKVGYAMNQLSFAGAKVLGFILNGVKPETTSRKSYGKYKKYKYYQYGYKRGYGYSSGYGGYGYGYGYGRSASGHYGYGSPSYDPRFEVSQPNPEAAPHGEAPPPSGGGERR